MRIIAGQFRSREIDWPRSGTTRPITDRARQSLFDVLGARYGLPGTLPPLSVADVFAGGGSLGLEALSRGAESVCFFERNAEAIKVLNANLDRLKAGPEAVVIAADVWRNPPAAASGWRPFELVFVDPPFVDTRDTTAASRITKLLHRLAQGDRLAADALLVVRHETTSRFEGIAAKAWTVDDVREIGGSAISFLIRHAGATDPLSNPEKEDLGGEGDEFTRGG